MTFSRRSFIGWLSTGLCASVFSRAYSQARPPTAPPAQPPNAAQFTLGRFDPYQVIENAASAMQAADPDSVRPVVDAIFIYPHLYRIPPPMVAVLKQRFIAAEVSHLNGKTAGVQEGSVVDALDALVNDFQLPDYAMVSLLQVQLIRVGLVSAMPVFMRSTSGPAVNLGEPNPPMSPLQAMVAMSVLIDQKLINPDYQAPPAEWDRDFYPRLAAQMRAAQELRRRIAAGEVKPQYRGEVRLSTDRGLQTILGQRIAAMSVLDGLNLFSDVFARLGIG